MDLYAQRHSLGLFAFLVFAVVYLIPTSKILRRAGWNGWLALLWAVPLVNIIMLWVFAFGEWPNLPARSPTSAS
jgi:ATP/ADP translocase